MENIKINKSFLEKAEAIILENNENYALEIKEDKEKENYIEKCIEANICPCCGCELRIEEDGDEGGWCRDYSCTGKECNFSRSYDGDYE